MTSTDVSTTPAVPATAGESGRPETRTMQMWRKLADRPAGTRLFSVAASLAAPYFATVLPHVTEMEAGRAVVRAPKWWGINNHIGTFHAIAACNVAEMAMGMLCEASVPATHRWVPKAMDVKYKTISKGGLTGVAEADLPDFGAITPETGGVDMPVRITLTDSRGTVVQECVITTWVTAKKPKAS
ncbi:hotdog fold domain-containing protein [Corynebacterium sp. 335C]